MFHTPNPGLNEEERALLGTAPEECLRQAVQRGALSLDPITEQLGPRAAAAVRNMVTEERASTPGPPEARSLKTREAPPDQPPSMGAVLFGMVTGDHKSDSSEEEALPPMEGEPADQPGREKLSVVRRRAMYQNLGAWPSLQQAVDEEDLTLAEAMSVAHTIDDVLGRYTTGTRYAAP